MNEQYAQHHPRDRARLIRRSAIAATGIVLLGVGGTAALTEGIAKSVNGNASTGTTTGTTGSQSQFGNNQAQFVPQSGDDGFGDDDQSQLPVGGTQNFSGQNQAQNPGSSSSPGLTLPNPGSSVSGGTHAS